MGIHSPHPQTEINREEGLANPGCWTRNGENPGTYILIEKDGGVELLEEF